MPRPGVSMLVCVDLDDDGAGGRRLRLESFEGAALRERRCFVAGQLRRLAVICGRLIVPWPAM